MTHKMPAPKNSATPISVTAENAAAQPSTALAAAAIVATTAHSQSIFESALLASLSLFVVAESLRHQILVAAVGEAAAEQWSAVLWQATHSLIPPVPHST